MEKNNLRKKNDYRASMLFQGLKNVLYIDLTNQSLLTLRKGEISMKSTLEA